MSPIKVLIIDDSAVVRQVLTATLGQDPAIEVIGAAADPVFAMDKMNKQWPDVIVLDVEMPRMDGITFLKKLMAEHPTPVVICSTLTEKGAATTMQALAAGAVSIVTKPQLNLRQFLTDSSEELAAAVKAAAKANMKRMAPGADRPPARLNADVILPASTQAMARTTESIVAIGTSTGGTQALELVTLNHLNVNPWGGKLNAASSVLKAYRKMIRIGKCRNTKPPQAAIFKPMDDFSECIEGPQAFDDGQVH
ncbi:response regulator, partial [Pseudomonas extremaustralis]|uniref:response regulator n=1 Tax=Pseudomonas extremaustralis TaxID=359110 RepID=UPI0023DEF2C2